VAKAPTYEGLTTETPVGEAAKTILGGLLSAVFDPSPEPE